MDKCSCLQFQQHKKRDASVCCICIGISKQTYYCVPPYLFACNFKRGIEITGKEEMGSWERVCLSYWSTFEAWEKAQSAVGLITWQSVCNQVTAQTCGKHQKIHSAYVLKLQSSHLWKQVLDSSCRLAKDHYSWDSLLSTDSRWSF